ncbi:MAG: exodeoxyribonuclease VII large subunit [Bdellovibrio sp.]|jgi:exodeoxyribonuclease VII large subunit
MIESPSQHQPQDQSESAVLTVEQLNRHIRQLIEGELELVWVQGEISNFKAHTSGHFYFSLKDAKSQISAVMFRGHNSRLKFKPTDGLQVIVRGRVTVYEPRGNYQIAVEMMDPVGAGALQKAYEQLKAKLKSEGLFEGSRKKPLPSFPKHIAIVTSPTGAAIRDMMNILARRNKMVPVTLVPTIVQGEGSAEKVLEALGKAQRLTDVDVIIIGRGGGSIEDMWGFNDEKLARAIAASPIPIVSAVGHEIDFTIADFVADVRAPTPSAAAELVVKNTADLVQNLFSLNRMLWVSIEKFLRHEKQKVGSLSIRLVDPKRRLQDLMIRRDELSTRLQQEVIKLFEKRRMRVRLLESKLVSPDVVILRLKARIEKMQIVGKNRIQSLLDRSRSRLYQQMSVLETLSPLKTVERGYSVTRKGKAVVTSIKQVKVGDELLIRLSDGELKTKVIEQGETHGL